MKILVMSDSHGHTGSAQRILEACPEMETVVFLGDGIRDIDWMEDAYPERRFYSVRGNCDMGSFLPAEGLAPFGGVLVLYTHGHLYEVKSGRGALAEAAAQKGADIALYGHTHIPRAETLSGMPVCNPGAVSSTPPSYGVLVVENGAARFETHTL